MSSVPLKKIKKHILRFKRTAAPCQIKETKISSNTPSRADSFSTTHSSCSYPSGLHGTAVPHGRSAHIFLCFPSPSKMPPSRRSGVRRTATRARDGALPPHTRVGGRRWERAIAEARQSQRTGEPMQRRRVRQSSVEVMLSPGRPSSPP